MTTDRFQVKPVFGSLAKMDRRWNLVILAEGYTLADLEAFHADALQVAQTLLTTPPFDRYTDAINIIRVDVISQANGIKLIEPMPERSPFNTYFKAFYQNVDTIFNPNRMFVFGDGNKVIDTIQAQPELHGKKIDAILVIVNSPDHGGISAPTGTKGGTVAWTPKEMKDTKPVWLDTALHELGHNAFEFADEYDHDLLQARYSSGTEPAAPNVTRYANRDALRAFYNLPSQSKPALLAWYSMIKPATPTPSTETNETCQSYTGDQQPRKPGVTDHDVGLFEGALHYRCGIYRSYFNCKMREEDHPFCPVCQWAIGARLGKNFITVQKSQVIDAWTHVQSYMDGDQARLVFYNIATGAYSIYAATDLTSAPMSPSGSSIDAIWSWLVPFTLNGTQYFFAYEFGTGRRAIYGLKKTPHTVTDPLTLLPTTEIEVSLELKWDAPPEPATFTWTQVAFFESGGKPHYIGYNAFTGAVTIDRIDAVGSDPTTVYGTPLDPTALWQQGWSAVVPVTLAGKPHVLSYKETTGAVQIQSLTPPGRGPITWVTPDNFWRTGLTHLFPFSLHEEAYILRYSSLDGFANLDQIRSSGKGADSIRNLTIPAGALTLFGVGAPAFADFTLPPPAVPGEVPEPLPFLVFYNALTRALTFYHVV